MNNPSEAISKIFEGVVYLAYDFVRAVGFLIRKPIHGSTILASNLQLGATRQIRPHAMLFVSILLVLYYPSLIVAVSAGEVLALRGVFDLPQYFLGLYDLFVANFESKSTPAILVEAVLVVVVVDLATTMMVRMFFSLDWHRWVCKQQLMYLAGQQVLLLFLATLAHTVAIGYINSYISPLSEIRRPIAVSSFAAWYLASFAIFFILPIPILAGIVKGRERIHGRRQSVLLAGAFTMIGTAIFGTIGAAITFGAMSVQTLLQIHINRPVDIVIRSCALDVKTEEISANILLANRRNAPLLLEQGSISIFAEGEYKKNGTTIHYQPSRTATVFDIDGTREAFPLLLSSGQAVLLNARVKKAFFLSVPWESESVVGDPSVEKGLVDLLRDSGVCGVSYLGEGVVEQRGRLFVRSASPIELPKNVVPK